MVRKKISATTTGNYVIPHIPAPIVHALSGIQVNFIY